MRYNNPLLALKINQLRFSGGQPNVIYSTDCQINKWPVVIRDNINNVMENLNSLVLQLTVCKTTPYTLTLTFETITTSNNRWIICKWKYKTNSIPLWIPVVHQTYISTIKEFISRLKSSWHIELMHYKSTDDLHLKRP